MHSLDCSNQEDRTSDLTPEAPPMKMGWFKFLIHFALIASAILNVLAGIRLIAGLHYYENRDFFYFAFPGLQEFDFILGLVIIAFAVFLLYTRSRLAGFWANGPKMLTITHCALILINIVQIVGQKIIYSQEPRFVVTLDYSTYWTAIVVQGILMLIDLLYFKKRSHLFVY